MQDFKIASILLTVVFVLSFNQACTPRTEAAQGKFSKTTQGNIGKACGNGLTENSGCGICGTFEGITITVASRCDHYCVGLPAGKTDKDMNIAVSAAFNRDPGGPVASDFKPCGSLNTPGACSIGWSRYESAEYYPKNNNMCGRVKSWDSDREIVFHVSVSEK